MKLSSDMLKSAFRVMNWCENENAILFKIIDY